MLREETVFGPIHSRRLGNSLGINLLPEKGKFCNFDCIYCECGWNKDGTADRKIPSAAEVRSALENKLCAMLLDSESVDSITFSGDGEPTLNPEFPRIIEDTLKLRDIYQPSAKVSVLTNATRIHIPEVFDALRKVDNPILKLDALTPKDAAAINKPAPGYDIARTMEAMKRFEGDFIMQTMFLKGPGIDSSAPERLQAWKEAVRMLRPREVMVYTIDRPTPMQGLEKFTAAQMKEMVQDLIDEGFRIRING